MDLVKEVKEKILNAIKGMDLNSLTLQDLCAVTSVFVSVSNVSTNDSSENFTNMLQKMTENLYTAPAAPKTLNEMKEV